MLNHFKCSNSVTDQRNLISFKVTVCFILLPVVNFRVSPVREWWRTSANVTTEYFSLYVRISAWVTPIDFQLQRGLLNYETNKSHDPVVLHNNLCFHCFDIETSSGRHCIVFVYVSETTVPVQVESFSFRILKFHRSYMHNAELDKR